MRPIPAENLVLCNQTFFCCQRLLFVVSFCICFGSWFPIIHLVVRFVCILSEWAKIGKWKRGLTLIFLFVEYHLTLSRKKYLVFRIKGGIYVIPENDASALLRYLPDVQ